MTLLLLTDFYPPGFRSGGPARSCYHLSVGLGQRLPVQVLTRDRDLDSPLPYPDTLANQWTTFATGVSVQYLSPAQLGFTSILRVLRHSPGAVWYLNGMFSVPFTIFPLFIHWLGWIRTRVVLAPRGMLKSTALQFKPFKKKLFLSVFKALGWHRTLVFHASSEDEAADIVRVFGKAVRVTICPQPPEIGLLTQRVIHPKSSEITRFCLIGRVHPIKNIRKALELLSHLERPLLLDVIGGFEDETYLADCKSIAATLPPHIQVVFHGALPVVQTQSLLQQADFFYLLTQGENFGHAIFEALALGKPVIISDQTPWRDLVQKKAGWDFSLQNEPEIRQVLEQAIAMGEADYQRLSEGAYTTAQAYVNGSNWLEAYEELFFSTAP